MENTLKVLNAMERDGIIERYAIGGAIALLFYTEPIETEDLDVFVFIPESGGKIVSLSPMYEYLKQRGHRIEGPYIHIEGVPVQFIPAYNTLVEEAVRKARKQPYGQTEAKVLRSEHLLAIMLQTGRAKDLTRITLLQETGKLSGATLQGILKRHGLTQRWRDFVKRYKTRLIEGR